MWGTLGLHWDSPFTLGSYVNSEFCIKRNKSVRAAGCKLAAGTGAGPPPPPPRQASSTTGPGFVGSCCCGFHSPVQQRVRSNSFSSTMVRPLHCLTLRSLSFSLYCLDDQSFHVLIFTDEFFQLFLCGSQLMTFRNCD